MGFCTSWAVDIKGSGQEWIEVVETDLRVSKAAEQFHGMRIVHISDLHCGRAVSAKYLSLCIDRVNQLQADIVLLTGDYVTHDFYGRFRKKILKVLSGITSRHGVYACMGNHDYGVDGLFGSPRKKRLAKMIEGMENCGINVLRNQSAVLKRGRQRLRFVGLGDLWANDFHPKKAFAGSDKNDEIVIALAHNPEAVKYMHDYDYDILMSGHTHGAQFQFTRTFSKKLLNRHDYFSGLYEVGGKQLYVNRGLGRLGRFFFNTSPEIAVFNLCLE